MKNRKLDKRTGRGWAWMLEDGTLCNWVEPDRARLGEHRPSTGARAVRVRIIPSLDWLELNQNLDTPTPKEGSDD